MPTETSLDFKIFALFAATAVSVAALHIGLVRLAISLDEQDGPRERPGVLIVIQFALVAMLGSSIPIVVSLFQEVDDQKVDGQYVVGSWLIPLLMLLIVILDLNRIEGVKINGVTKNPTGYYALWVAIIIVGSLTLIALNVWFDHPFRVFIASLGLALLVCVAQLFISASRVGKTRLVIQKPGVKVGKEQGNSPGPPASIVSPRG